MIRSDFSFEKIRDDTYLITNYAGRYAFLSGDEFTAFCKGNDLNPDTRQKLIESYFCADASSEQFMVVFQRNTELSELSVQRNIASYICPDHSV